MTMHKLARLRHDKSVKQATGLGMLETIVIT